MQAVHVYDGLMIDYTPDSAVDAGDVVVIGNRVLIANLDIAASELGALAAAGVFEVVKVSGAISDGAELFWDADGDPYGGTAGSGALSTDPSVGPFAGHAIGAAGSTDATVTLQLGRNEVSGRRRSSVYSVAATGSAQGDAAALKEDALNTVSAADGTKGVVLPAAAAGSRCRVYNEHASNGLKIYPASGDDINDGTTNAAITIEGKTVAVLEAIDGTTWTAVFTANS